MDGGRLQDLRRFPGNRAAEREVHFEHARAVPVAFELADVASRQVAAGNLEELAGAGVEQDHFGIAEFVERTHRRVREDLAAERLEI